MNSVLRLAMAILYAIPLASTSPQQRLRNLLEETENGLARLGLKPNNSEAFLDTPQLALRYGYTPEIHKITTEDDYILTVHRIPNGKNAPPPPAGGGRRPVVWLQHGLLGSSADWLYPNRFQPLAFRLADAGYDVWMGNNRGNYYSKEHRYLSIKSKEYWAFSSHEVGKYDLPAYFDYVQNVTGKSDLFYIGHSLGTTVFFVCMSLRPEYNDRIRLMSGLAPVADGSNTASPVRYLVPFAQSTTIYDLLGIKELLPTSPLNDILGATVCNQLSPIQSLCSNILFLTVGFDSVQLNKTLIPTILGHTPAGTSVKTFVHAIQSVKSRLFRQFDYGKKKNKAVYGQLEPPEYDLCQVTAPVALYYAMNDRVAVPNDVLRLADSLPNVQRVYRVPFDKFNHLDFLWAIDVVRLVYRPLELFMALY